MYYSVVFPSRDSRAKAAVCPWLLFRPQRVPGGYTLRGNKMYPSAEGYSTEGVSVPSFFLDTCLDQVLDEAIPANAGEYLRPLFYALSTGQETVLYRQAIVRALERADISALFGTFCRGIESALRMINDGRNVHTQAQREKYVVDGAVAYCDAVRNLLKEASGTEIPPCGLTLFVDEVHAYAESPAFRKMETAVRQAKARAEKITYQLRVEKGKVIVSSVPKETDFIRETQEAFAPVDCETAAMEGASREIKLFGQLELCPLGTLITDALQTFYPGEFAELSLAAGTAEAIPEPTIQAFVQEIPFYYHSLETVKRLGADGYACTLPTLSEDGAISLRGAYDIALALKRSKVVPNDLSLGADERGVVVTGANHSGKTTFLRTIGQIAVLTALGLPVPCAEAKLPLYGEFYSHFSEPEKSDSEQGRLKEELLCLRPVLDTAGSGSLVLLNEMFSSTTARDAQAMTEGILKTLTGRGARVLCVTHTVCEIPKGIVSMTSLVKPDTHERLYQIVRAPAASHAYTAELALKYRLTCEEIRERVVHGV